MRKRRDIPGVETRLFDWQASGNCFSALTTFPKTERPTTVPPSVKNELLDLASNETAGAYARDEGILAYTPG